MAYQTITSPVMLDETGQNIVGQLQNILAALQHGALEYMYIVPDTTAYSISWLSNGSQSFIPTSDTLYVVVSQGDYHNHIYRWNPETTSYEPLASTVEVLLANASRNGLLSSTDYNFIQSLKPCAKVYQASTTLTAGQTSVTFTDDTLTSDCIIEPFTSNGIQYTTMTLNNHVLTLTFPAQQDDVTVKVRWS